MRSGRINNMNDNMENNYNKKSKKVNKLKRKHIISMIIWLVITVFVIYQVYRLLMYTLGKVEKEDMWLYNGVNSVVDIFFDNSNKEIQEEHTLKFAGLGDVYLTNTMIKSGKEGTTYNFSEGTDKIKEKLENFDVVVASLSTPVADKSLGYSNKSIYNAPVELLDTLKELKVTAVATATDHSMDKNEKGILSTIDTLKNAGIDQVGMNSTEQRNNPLVISKNEINIGLLSYATTSNVKISQDKTYLINILNEEDVKKDIEYLKSKNVDYTIAYLNDPNSDSLITSGKQKQNVEMLFENGVNVVLGTGSMVVQGQVEDKIQIDENTANHIYSIYSLGDFFGIYTTDDNKSSVIANIEFTKNIKKNKKGEIKETVVSMNIKTPIFIWTSLSKNNIKTMYVMNDVINEYNAGNSDLSSKEYEKIVDANERLKDLFE